MSTHFIVLAAGLGSRLGRPHHKGLTPLMTGETILERQLKLIAAVEPTSVTVVTGFAADTIKMLFSGTCPDLRFVNNPNYLTTNTSKSLLLALQSLPEESDVIWLNGDVVFSEQLLPRLLQNLVESTIGTTTHEVSDEEIKFTTTPDGGICCLSKTVPLEDAEGEGVGVNFVQAADMEAFIHALQHVEDNDYFEKAVELTIHEGSARWVPFSLTDHDLTAVEVDYEEDLVQANNSLMEKN
jgi:choline kinase